MIKYSSTVLIGIITTLFATAQPVKQATVFFKAGVNFEEKGLFNEAVASYKKATVLNKKYDSAYLRQALLYTKISKADSAIIVLKNAAKQKPGFVDAFITMGNIYRDIKNEPDEAITNYLMALNIDSTNKVTFYSLAWCYNSKKYFREAIRYAIKALEIDNNYKPAYNELGHAYNQLKAYDECIAQFKKNLAVSVNELPLLYSAFSYLELNQKDAALKMYEALKKINPKMAEGLKKKIDAKQ
ncbi:MAG: hypothetical protein RIS73_298 [Bacteroidota bacterium]|jgi:tetratricopeptide (TPR) repeat protein